jgi:hypothetical protein
MRYGEQPRAWQELFLREIMHVTQQESKPYGARVLFLFAISDVTQASGGLALSREQGGAVDFLHRAKADALPSAELRTGLIRIRGAAVTRYSSTTCSSARQHRPTPAVVLEFVGMSCSQGRGRWCR